MFILIDREVKGKEWVGVKGKISVKTETIFNMKSRINNQIA